MAQLYPHNRGMSRRSFLSDLTLATSAATLAAASANPLYAKPSDETNHNNRYQLSGIGKHNIVEAYHARQLDALSDAELYQQAAAIIATPSFSSNSFVLHAPLELMARYGLLQMVPPQQRTMARIQLTASAVVFEAGIDPVPMPQKLEAFKNIEAAGLAFQAAIKAKDMVAMDKVTLQMGRQFGIAPTLALLAKPTLTTLEAASHAHIGVWLLLRHGMSGPFDQVALLRHAARLMTRHPEYKITCFPRVSDITGKKLNMTAAEIEAFVIKQLIAPIQKGRISRGIRPLLQAAQDDDLPEKLFGEMIRHDMTSEQMDAAFRGALRIAARAMLLDDNDHAKFGWSHQLTLTQAACGLSTMGADRKLCLAIALAWSAAYRSFLSEKPLDPEYVPPKTGATMLEALYTSREAAAGRAWHATPEELPQIMGTIAGQASIRNDQHLVKYVRACFDMIGFDPAGMRLYLAGAASLCALWIAEYPLEGLKDNLLAGRKTPEK